MGPPHPPNTTNFIPKAFHPLPYTRVTADTPSCRELLGQHCTETHYSADSRELVEKPGVQIEGWLQEDWFSHSCGVMPCRQLVQTPFTPLLSQRQDRCFYQGHMQRYTISAESISACRGLR